MKNQDQTASTHKTKINIAIVSNFLERSFTNMVSNIKYISGGESSQAFSFKVDNEEYVIRVNDRNPDGFRKDEYAFKHFSSNGIPIPEVISLGKMNDDYYFCISRKAKGKTIEAFSDLERENILPDILHVLDKIHAIDILGKAGYGKWNSDGIAKKASWRDALLSVDEYVWGDEGKPSFFETTFLRQDMWERGYKKMLDLLPYCPEEKYLVHGDAGSDNILSDGNHVTAVIDWADSRYGDFLFDVAWLIFWCTDDSYKKICLDYYADREIPHIAERLLCYQIFIGLNSLSFYAYSNQEDKAQFSIRKLLKLLE